MGSAAAAPGIESYKGWSCCSRPGPDQHNAFQHMQQHSPSFRPRSCRVQTSAAARLIMCTHQIAQVAEDAGLLKKARRMRSSKRNCIPKGPVITNTTLPFWSNNSHRVLALEAMSTPAIATTANYGVNTTITTTTTDEHIHNDPPSPSFTRRSENDEVGVQELTVYEVNERDRDSPVLLLSSKLAVDWYKRVSSLGGLGDMVPFTNKLFDGSLKKRLGITAGIITVIRYYPKENGFLYESVYSFYFGDFGHISVKGPYKTHEDTILTVTGGSGIFSGVYGTVQISNVEFPIVLFYKFELYGIPQLPQALRWKTIPPTKGLRPTHNASLPGFALPNFTD